MTAATPMAAAPSIVLRSGDEGDVPWMAEQCEAFAAVHGLRYPGFDRACGKLYDLFAAGAVCWVAERHATDTPPSIQPVGFLLSAPDGPHFWTDEPHLPELLWWTAPDARGAGAGTALLDAWIAEADARGAMASLTVLPETPLSPEVLTARGFRVREVAWVREVAR